MLWVSRNLASRATQKCLAKNTTIRRAAIFFFLCIRLPDAAIQYLSATVSLYIYVHHRSRPTLRSVVCVQPTWQILPMVKRKSKWRPQPDFAKMHPEVCNYLSKFSVADFFDTSNPWILADNGSFMGCFDFVPSMFRKGDWAVIPIIFITGALYVIYFAFAYMYAVRGIQDLPRDFYPAYSLPWVCNLTGFLWTSYVFRNIFVSGPGMAALTTFTVQSYLLILLRLLLSTAVPFLPVLAPYNELLRYPVLSQATITFIVWNLILAPVIYSSIKNEERRKRFVKYFTNFRLMQLHFFNIFFAVFSGVYGTPARFFVWTDLLVASLLGTQYFLFYIFVLDRLGLHFYMIFSPRTNLAVLSLSLVIYSTIGLYSYWDAMIQKHGVYWETISWAY